MPSDASVHPANARKGARWLLLIGAPILSSGFLVAFYAWHEHELMERQRRLLAETSTRLQEILITDQGLTESVMETPDRMTYDEFFRACDRSIEERDKLVVAVRLLSPEVLSALREQIISHMKGVNELVRAKAHLMHLVLQLQSKSKTHSDDFARLEAEFFRTHVGGEREAIEWAYGEAVAELRALTSETKESAGEFDALYDRLADEEQGILVEARQAGITFESGLKKFAAANRALSARARSAAK